MTAQSTVFWCASRIDPTAEVHNKVWSKGDIEQWVRSQREIYFLMLQIGISQKN